MITGGEQRAGNDVSRAFSARVHVVMMCLALPTLIIARNALRPQANNVFSERTRQFARRTTVTSMDFNGVYARAFTPWVSEDTSFPCDVPDVHKNLRSDDIESTRTGFFHLKTKKTGSSTAASVHLRIAHNVARAKLNAMQRATARYGTDTAAHSHAYNDTSDLPICRMRHRHAQAWDLNLTQRIRDRSFAWTTLRDPTKRAISSFFFYQVSGKRLPPTDANFLIYLRGSPIVPMHYFQFLDAGEQHTEASLDALSKNITKQREIANNIMVTYDFIALTERMDESIVALQLLLGLQTRDVLRLDDSKRAGSFDAGASDRGCSYITPSTVSPRMHEYFYGPNNTEWMQRIQMSEALHQAANASLDLTIDSLGWDRFRRALDQYRDAQRHIAEKCETHELVPCSFSAGDKPRENICVDRDMGCGFDCIDRVADELGLPEYEYVGNIS